MLRHEINDALITLDYPSIISSYSTKYSKTQNPAKPESKKIKALLKIGHGTNWFYMEAVVDLIELFKHHGFYYEATQALDLFRLAAYRTIKLLEKSDYQLTWSNPVNQAFLILLHHKLEDQIYSKMYDVALLQAQFILKLDPDDHMNIRRYLNALQRLNMKQDMLDPKNWQISPLEKNTR